MRFICSYYKVNSWNSLSKNLIAINDNNVFKVKASEFIGNSIIT